MARFYYTVFIFFVPALFGSCSHFLGPNPVERNPYSRGYYRSSSSAGDIVFGMDRDEVLSSWGEPGKVQIAGNPNEGNERWVYSESGSRYFGESRSRFVYFKNGRVSGWETKPFAR